jgi:hypothetical protein
MAFAFVGSDTAQVTAATQVSINPPGPVGTFFAVVYAFQGVAAGSGPWIIPNTGQFSTSFIGPSEGWQQACMQAPGATGVGLEVWCAINGSGGGGARIAAFVSSSTCQATAGAWSGAYAPTGSIFNGAVRSATTAQVTGNTPAAPSIVATAGDLVIPCGASLMASPGFGTPTGYTLRIDGHNGGFGNVEAAMADAVAAVSGATGVITFPGTAASSLTRGTTATLDIRPTPPVPTSAGLTLDFTYPTT